MTIHITPALLRAATGCSDDAAHQFAGGYDFWAAAFGISEDAGELAMFSATIAHESGALRRMWESLDYTPDRLLAVFGPRRISPDLAHILGRAADHPADQQRIAEAVYGGAWGAKHLGNTELGDGWAFRGCCHIQSTGRDNARRATAAIRRIDPACPDFEAQPERRAEPEWAPALACWSWVDRGCREPARAGDARMVRRRINGGEVGLEDFIGRLAVAQKALSLHKEIDNVATNTLPAGDAPMPEPAEAAGPADQPTDSQEPETMAPILLGLGKSIILDGLPKMLQALPRIGALFAGDSEVAKRNLELVKVVTETIAPAVGATNAQQLVEALDDPQKLAAARQAVDANWSAIHAAHEASIDKARDFMVEHGSARVIFGNMVFHEILALVMVLLTGAGMTVAFIWGGLSSDTKNQIITVALIGGFMGIKEFFFGGSRGSDAKTEMIARNNARK